MKVAGRNIVSANVQLAEAVNTIGQNLANTKQVQVNQVSPTMLAYIENNRQVRVNVSVQNLVGPMFRIQSIFVPEKPSNNQPDPTPTPDPDDDYNYDSGNGNGNGDNGDNNGNGNGQYVAPIPVEYIELDDDELTLAITGETSNPVYPTHQLTATIIPDNATNKKLLWESSDNNVVEVDETGYLTATGAGEAIITVSDYDELVTAYCDVEIVDDTI